MKKFLLIAALAVFGLSTSAANLRVSRTFSEKKSNTTWILRAGANFAGISQSACDDHETNDDYGKKTGYDVAISFQKPLSDFGMFWGMELGLGTRGYSYDESNEYASYEESILAHNVRFSPFTFGYAYSINDNMKVDAHLGGWVSYDFAGTYKWEKSYGNKTEEDDCSIGDLEDYTEIDAGVTFGVGFWYNRFNIDLSWQRGFVSMFDYECDCKMSTNNLMLRVGVAF